MLKAGIDKIRLKLPKWVDLPPFLERAFTRLGLRDRQCKLYGTKNGLRLYSTVTQLPSGILIELPKFGFQKFRFITIKATDNFNVFELFYNLKSLFGSSILDAEIKRIDYCVDYQISTSILMMGIGVKYKRATSKFLYDRGIKTGLMFGKYPEVVIVYDKSREMRANDGIDRTRIEVQLYRHKKPIKSLREISKCYRTKNKAITPFSKVSIQKVDFPPESKFIADPKKYRKAIEVRTLVQELGFNLTKHKLNHNGNFVRDYIRPGYLELSDLAEHPDKILERALDDYFRDWEDAFVNKNIEELFKMSKLKEDDEVGNLNSPTWAAEQNHVKELPSEL